MATKIEQCAARTRQAEFRAEEQSIRDVLDREWRERGDIGTTGDQIDLEDTFATARFIGSLRQRREEAGLSLADLAERTGIDKALLSRLENGSYPDPTLSTLERYARGVGQRLILEMRPVSSSATVEDVKHVLDPAS